MVTNSQLIPDTKNKYYTPDDDFEFDGEPIFLIQSFYNRITRSTHGRMYMFGVLALIIYIAFKNTLLHVIFTIIEKILQKMGIETEEPDCEVKSKDIYRELLIDFLQNLYYKSQRELERFRTLVREDYQDTKIFF
jgi:hypothetical protein